VLLWLAFGLGTGLLRPAPGTWGSLLGVGIAAGLMPLPWLHLFVLLVLIPIGIWLSQRATHLLGVHDHGSIVIDEIVGMLLTLLFIPLSWQTLLVGFLAFRFFDIVKPSPIGWLDKKVNGGLGIMLDDLVAGMFAWVVVFTSCKWVL